MEVQELLATLAERGISVRLDGDLLRIRPKSALTAELRQELRHRESEVLGLFRNARLATEKSQEIDGVTALGNLKPNIGTARNYGARTDPHTDSSVGLRNARDLT